MFCLFFSVSKLDNGSWVGFENVWSLVGCIYLPLLPYHLQKNKWDVWEDSSIKRRVLQMASDSMNTKYPRNHFTKGKRQQHPQTKTRSPISDGDGDDSFIFEAQEAWKDFHGSLLRFYENGELCDVTLKVRLYFFLFSVSSEYYEKWGFL